MEIKELGKQLEDQINLKMDQLLDAIEQLAYVERYVIYHNPFMEQVFDAVKKKKVK